MPRWSSSFIWLSTTSPNITVGKARPYGLPVAGLREVGPEDP
jgi:hypothetical protein